MKKVRLTLDLSQHMNQVLEEIARETGSPKSEVLRDAIKLARAAHDARREKRRVGATAPGSDKLEKEFIF
jgi:hypothetical protein